MTVEKNKKRGWKKDFVEFSRCFALTNSIKYIETTKRIFISYFEGQKIHSINFYMHIVLQMMFNRFYPEKQNSQML